MGPDSEIIDIQKNVNSQSKHNFICLQQSAACFDLMMAIYRVFQEE
jgi:hypothetical protein